MTNEPVAQWHETGVRFQPGTTFEEWQAEWLKAESVDKAIPWVIGDSLVWGEDHYEEWSQVVDATYAEKHRSKIWLSRKYPESQRRKGFSWSFHREIAALDRLERDAWFLRAEQERWNTVERLKQEMLIDHLPRRASSGPSAPMSGHNDYHRENPVDDWVSPMSRPPEPNLDPETESQEPAPTNELGQVPESSLTFRIRMLIDDVRAFGLVAPRITQEDLADLTDRINTYLNVFTVRPLEISDEALAIKAPGWRAGIEETDTGSWRVIFRKPERQMAIAAGPHLPSCIIEACLAAYLSDLAEINTKD